MAIQFNCPYCTATIQVPDHAAGKKGTCPQCRTKLLVPAPRERPASALQFTPQVASQQFAPPQFAPSQFAPTAFPPGQFAPQWPPPQNAGAPMFAPLPPPGPASFAPPQFPASGPAIPNFEAAPPVAGPRSFEPPEDVPVVTKRTAKRRKSGHGVLMAGIVAVVVIGLGVVAYFAIQSRTKPGPVKGELTATRRPDGKLDPVVIPREWINVEDEVVAAVLKQMEQRTIKLRSERMELRFYGTPEGIKVLIGPGPSGDLVAIDIEENKDLVKWAKRESPKLTDKHEKNVIRAATNFVKEWVAAEARGEKRRDFSAFQDELGLGAMKHGLGNEVVAVTGDGQRVFVKHLCVAEQKGKLFFLLPSGTKNFELIGQEHADKKVLFPYEFRVKVVAGLAATRSTKSRTNEMSDDEPADMKSSPFGVPALNDDPALDSAKPKKTPPKDE